MLHLPVKPIAVVSGKMNFPVDGTVGFSYTGVGEKDGRGNDDTPHDAGIRKQGHDVGPW